MEGSGHRLTTIDDSATAEGFSYGKRYGTVVQVGLGHRSEIPIVLAANGIGGVDPNDRWVVVRVGPSFNDQNVEAVVSLPKAAGDDRPRQAAANDDVIPKHRYERTVNLEEVGDGWASGKTPSPLASTEDAM